MSEPIDSDNFSQPSTNQNIMIEQQFEEYRDDSRESKLRQYHLLLQGIEMERRLGENNMKTKTIANNNTSLVLRFE